MIVDTMKVYVAVVEQRNFSRAAELLHLSQPGVSQHIRNLEQEFGVQLIHRSPKHVKLTEAGEILYKHAKEMIARYEAAREDIGLLRDEVTGSLRIGASFTIGEYILPRIVASFARQYPSVDVQVTIANTEQIAQSVRANELDIGLVEGKIEYKDLQLGTPFMEDEMVLVVSPNHSFASMPTIEPSMLHDEVWVLREQGSGTRAYSDQFMSDLKLHIKRSYVFNSSQSVKEAVMAGLGIAMLSYWVIRKEQEHGELRLVHVKGKSVKRAFHILQDNNASATMAMTMFIEQVRHFKMR
ncbi:LysR family transcriptional regulator [Paenibacillus alvei]|uniref:LysR family transcriptional regulator n=2 Tax=Paenibacillus TaxID=44249 RepID=A0ABT4GU23_PAEAL|nr:MULTISPECIES: LysR family transcriptional regulator [Paenibacillus]EJW17778.1 HTH-type transcriptional regulator CysL [Paenibacillus alvei DSM 29]MCY7483212.1 LysR family transcriptional regulator [Paenibacillus alvei]MCY9543156.1 LysR family transcriptional regulator [Paenibacillus alvei]MCY9707224.1 LysR family transcriptional regulator [Paenibacillus alvei]MCY9733649.1 LysR family transcriptional regulator [Paenibacillus alvei]